MHQLLLTFHRFALSFEFLLESWFETALLDSSQKQHVDPFSCLLEVAPISPESQTAVLGIDGDVHVLTDSIAEFHDILMRNMVQ